MGCVLAGSLLGPAALAAQVPVPNGSFESPATGFVSTLIDSWQKKPQPAWWDPNPANTGGYSWDQTIGSFKNTAVGASDHIDNVDGNQAVYLFGNPDGGVFQELSDTYQIGDSYHLTAGFIGGGGGMKSGASMLLQLYYLDGTGNHVPVGSTRVTNTLAAFPNTTHFVDYSVDIPAVRATDLWAGKAIGVELISGLTPADLDPNTGLAGGYWDVENVRLVSAAPEPASLTLVLSLTGLALRRRRK